MSTLVEIGSGSGEKDEVYRQSDGRKAILKDHLSFQLRLANNYMYKTKYIVSIFTGFFLSLSSLVHYCMVIIT